ncbi:unnamed protein product, partial [Didymodactylos carnosus]
WKDSDAINQLIIKMSTQIPLTIDNFLLVARTTDSQEELKTLTERLEHEIGKLRSKDIGGENDADIRATLNSYKYLKRLLNDRLDLQQRLESSLFDEDDLPQKVSYHDLPLTEILNNSNGLDYFLKFLQSVDGVGYGNFYLNAEGTFKLSVDENLIKKTLKVLQSETIDETLLDDLQNNVFEILSSDKYYGQFKTTPQYLKVLSEIDFIDSITMDNSDAASLSSVCSEKGDKYAIYVISVLCKPVISTKVTDADILKQKEWITYRRFSEFNDLHITIRKRYRDLQYIQLPQKSLINSTNQDVRLKRQKELNNYLMALLDPKVLSTHPYLADLLLKFLRNQQWKCEQTEFTRKDIVKSTVDTLVNPFKQSALGIKNAVTSLPGNVVKSVNKVADGIQIVSDSVTDNMGKLFRTGQSLNDASRALQTFPIVEDYQSGKNIPLRVLLVIMDEIFDLKQKNMWFRSRFVSILKRVLRTFMGGSFNRRIADFVRHWTSAPKIAKEIRRFKDNYWPNGIIADKPAERDESIKHVTQVLCKAKLLGIVSDELRHIIGSETTRRGLLRLFELLQNETLNRRFIFVLFEAILIKLFRPNDLHLIFEKLYSKSSRVKDEYKRRNHEVRSNDQLNVNMMLTRTNSVTSNNSNITGRNMPRSFSKISY